MGASLLVWAPSPRLEGALLAPLPAPSFAGGLPLGLLLLGFCGWVLSPVLQDGMVRGTCFYAFIAFVSFFVAFKRNVRVYKGKS